MRKKAPLALMELMVMILVFALAAALCLQAFVKSDRLSRNGEARDRAAVACQSVAEVLRHTGGDFQEAARLLEAQTYEENSLMLDYDKNWNPAEDTMRYTVGAGLVDSGFPGLGKAAVWCRDEESDTELFRLEITWQKGGSGRG